MIDNASEFEAGPQAGAPAPQVHQQALLVVDDDPDISTLVAEQLVKAGYAVVTAGDGPTMRAALDVHRIDLIILDLNLPGEDGLALCRETRSRRDIPIIMLTARGEPIDRIIGLEVGADDYISKPFEPRELIARVRSVIRRAYHPLKPADPPPSKRVRFRDWTLDFEQRRLFKADGRVVMLSGSEYSLLKFLLEHANEVLTREQILTLTADMDDGHAPHAAQRIADLQISRLRQKLNDNARASDLIMTVRGQGYVLAAAVTFE
jgi:two-component system OmpR family response regulator